MKPAHVQWQVGHVTRAKRESLHGHRAIALWLTGLSGSGKSTIAFAVERELVERGISAYVLDGDNVRHGLNRDLGFSPAARSENLRRIGEVAKLFIDAGTLVLCAFVSPYRADREQLRAMLSERDFAEIYVDASLEVCRMRDCKGLYRKADQGLIADFTGVSAPYEPPDSPELVLHTDHQTLEESVGLVLRWLEARADVPPAVGT